MLAGKHKALIGLLFTIFFQLQGQDIPKTSPAYYSNLRVKNLQVTDTVLNLDTLAIFPNTFRLWYDDSTSVPDSLYHFNSRLAILRLHPSLIGTSLLTAYRVLPVKPFDTLQRYAYNPSFYFTDSLGIVYDPFYRQSTVSPESVFDFGGLNYAGSFSRGFNFGNNQNLSVNSALDLQLSGKFGDDLEIVAALSDNNIPIQPDGTTAQLQDFDKVYIRITKDQYQLVAGDYDISAAQNYFLRFNKQLQGGSFRAAFDFRDSLRMLNTASFAVAKGKFARNSFNGIENNQGPYRLTGAQNETFIIILAGSERVYVDGVRLQRGEELDYIIDYNTGEVTFTPNFLITKDVRIVIEFEYSEKNYFRSMVHSSHTIGGKKWDAGFSVYAEQDAKNRPVQADINEEIEAIMEGLGNNNGSTFFPSAKEEVFDPNRINYKLVDTLVDAVVYDSVFVYSTNEDSAIYHITFTYVGPGAGDYIPALNAANGRVYKWVAPVGGISQGSYAPVIQLTTPKKDHFLAFQGEYRPDEKTRLQAHMILGNRDPNTFSAVDNEENKGIGTFISLDRKDFIGKDSAITLNYGANYEFKSHYFQPLEPYRPIEFSRDYNLPADTSTEHWAQARLDISKGSTWRNVLHLSTFQRPGEYRGYREQLEHYLDLKGWNVKFLGSVLNAKSTTTKSVFLRPALEVSKWLPILKGWQLGVNGFMERNVFRNLSTDTLLSQSFQNQTVGAFFQTSDTSFVVTRLDYKYRADQLPEGEGFNTLTTSHTFEWNGAIREFKRQSFDWQFTYRKLLIEDTVRSNLQPENTILGRVSYRGSTRKNIFTYNFIYELGGGQERLKEFVYLEVPPGQGLYKWVDENQDGIQQENEYVISEFSDSASFIKVLTDFNEYIRARTVGFNQTMQVNPKAVWFDAKGIKGFLSRFMIRSSMQLRRKSLPGAEVSPFNPFIFSSNDTAIVTINNSLRNGIIFNTNDPVYGASYNWVFNQDKTLLVNGFDSRQKSEHLWEGRYTPAKITTINLLLSHGRSQYNSEFFPQNRYDIRFIYLQPGVNFYVKSSFRTGINYGFGNKDNIPSLGGEKMTQHKLTYELRYAKVSNLSLDAKFTFAQVEYSGVTGTTKSYQLLEGLQPGQNFLWSLDFEKKLAGYLQISLGYEGRKTGTANVVHTGKAGVRAIF